MLKFIFWALVAANAALFAYGQGYLGQGGTNQHEPARLQNQLAPERMSLLTTGEAKAVANEPVPAAAQDAPPAATPAPDTASAATPVPTPAATPAPELFACVQTGPFPAGEARRFESRIARLELGERESRIEVPFQEVTNHLVYLPPNGGREGAQRRTAELKEHGVENFFVMQEDSPLRWAVSLGVFKTETRAQKLVADLQAKGVRGVRVLGRGPQGTRPAYQFRRIDAATRERIKAIADDFTDGELRRCK